MWWPHEDCTIIWNLVKSRALLNAKVLLVWTCLHVTNFIANWFSTTSWRRMATSQLRSYTTVTCAWACWKICPSWPAYFVICWTLLFFVVFKFFIFLMKWCWTRWWFRLRDITITIVCVYKSKKYTLKRRKRRHAIQVWEDKKKLYLKSKVWKSKQHRQLFKVKRNREWEKLEQFPPQFS